MKKKEIIVFGVIFILALLFILFSGVFSNNDEKYVVITVDGQAYKTIELTEVTDMAFTIETDAGTNDVVIKDMTVDVVSATCPNQICVNTKSATDIGDVIVCLPHKVVIEIKKSE